MNWGRWITVSFVLFALFVASLVYVCVREDINLVSDSYYADEIAYQDQIDRLKNAKELVVLPSISVEQGFLKVEYEDLPSVTSGTLQLFRPSDEKLDQRFSISRTYEKKVQFRLATLPKGLYKARLTWEMNNKEYYFEKIIIL